MSPRLDTDMACASGFLLIGLWYLHTPVGPVLRVLNTGLAVLVLADVIRFRSKRFEVSPKYKSIVTTALLSAHVQNLYEQYLGFLMRVSEKVCSVCLRFHLNLV